MSAPSSHVTIRAARGDDFDTIAALLEEVGRPAPTEATRDDARAVYRAQVVDPSAHHMVVEDAAGTIVGFCALHFRARLNQSSEEAWVPELAVAPGARMREVGRALLEEAERRALERGCFGLAVESGHQHAEAHELCRSLKMRDTGRQFSKPLRRRFAG
jgi:ribosomal protein S18 acetylase RimI-like enzyme